MLPSSSVGSPILIGWKVKEDQKAGLRKVWSSVSEGVVTEGANPLSALLVLCGGSGFINEELYFRVPPVKNR